MALEYAVYELVRQLADELSTRLVPTKYFRPPSSHFKKFLYTLYISDMSVPIAALPRALRVFSEKTRSCIHRIVSEKDAEIISRLVPHQVAEELISVFGQFSKTLWLPEQYMLLRDEDIDAVCTEEKIKTALSKAVESQGFTGHIISRSSRRKISDAKKLSSKSKPLFIFSKEMMIPASPISKEGKGDDIYEGI